MEIQQHDGVVVEAAGFQQGFAKRYSRRKRCHGREREAPGAWVRMPSLPPLYIGSPVSAIRKVSGVAGIVPGPRLCLAKPCQDPAASTTTPSCCWISINLSLPLLDQEGGDVFPTVRVLNAEVLSVRHLVVGDLDHDEYDSINPILLNASARDLQGYVDALLSLSLLDDSID